MCVNHIVHSLDYHNYQYYPIYHNYQYYSCVLIILFIVQVIQIINIIDRTHVINYIRAKHREPFPGTLSGNPFRDHARQLLGNDICFETVIDISSVLGIWFCIFCINLISDGKKDTLCVCWGFWGFVGLFLCSLVSSVN